MKIVLLALFLVIAGGYALKHLAIQPPLRGMAFDPALGQQLLVSRTRPSLIMMPDAVFTMRASGWRSLAPKTRRSIAGDARLWFILYQQGQGKLVFALAEAENQWKWEAAHHSPFPVLRELQYDYMGQTLYESLYQLSSKEDPFAGEMSENVHMLIYRAKFLLFFRQMQVIIEYREPLPYEHVRDVRSDGALLSDFQERARQQWQVHFPDKEELAALTPHLTKMDTAPSEFARSKLSRWVGEMQWHEEL